LATLRVKVFEQEEKNIKNISYGQVDTGKGELRTTAQMTNPDEDTTIFINWDFANVWDIQASVNDGYPFLRWQYEVGMENPYINPVTEVFDLTNPSHVSPYLYSWGGPPDYIGPVTELVNDHGDPITLEQGGSDPEFTVHTSNLVHPELRFHEHFLTGLSLSQDDEVVFTINFAQSAPVTFTVTVIDSTPPPVTSATIDPEEADYDLNNPNNVETTITWNDASGVNLITVLDLIDHSFFTLNENDYSVATIDTETASLTIYQGYFSEENFIKGDVLEFTINFDEGDPTTLIVRVIDTTLVPFISATIDPTVADYDLNVTGNVVTTITWNNAESVNSVEYGDSPLALDTDYTVTGSEGSTATLAILDSFFAGQDPNVGDMLVFTINFDEGNPATLTLTVIDTKPPTVTSATINPTAADYDLNNPGTVVTTITWNDAGSVTSVGYGGSILVLDTDYTVNNHNGTATLAILDSFFAGQNPIVGEVLVFTITFDQGDSATLTVTVVDSTPPVVTSATIAPEEADYDLNNPGNVETTITWNDASSILSIEHNGSALTVNTDYEVNNNNGDTAMLTIYASFFAGQNLNADYELEFIIAFDVGDSATLTVTVVGEQDEPEKPDKPGRPDQPGKPDEPGKPDDPDQPGKPEKPDKPEKPEKPVKEK